jgi:hypothetical protein
MTLGALGVGAAAALVLSGARSKGRPDSYRVLFKQGPFELREYPHNDLTVATTGPRLVTADEPPATQQLVSFRYSSWPAPDREATAIRNLREWSAAHGYLIEGRPVVAYYDADWTPPILRRNEVLFRVRG